MKDAHAHAHTHTRTPTHAHARTHHLQRPAVGGRAAAGQGQPTYLHTHTQTHTPTHAHNRICSDLLSADALRRAKDNLEHQSAAIDTLTRVTTDHGG